jgi:hypothetical protein
MSVAVGDLNGDGRPDLAVCGTDASSVVLQDPALPGTWKGYSLYSLQKGLRVALGDVDGDGRLDVVTTGDRGCIVALQSPDVRGQFLSSYSLSSDACGGLSLGDFNRDGLLDVCCVEATTGTLLVTTGDPDFDLLRICSLNGLPPGEPVLDLHVASGDFDGDGRLDVCVVCLTASGAPDGRLTLFRDGL